MNAAATPRSFQPGHDSSRPAGARRWASQALSAAQNRLEPTAAGRVWRQLSELGFINSSLQFAAVFTLGFIPFLMLLSVAFGPGLTRAIVLRSGFSGQAAHDLAMLFTHVRTASASVTALAVVFAVLGGGTVAHMIQTWYAKTFQAQIRGWKAIARRAQWLAGVSGFLALQAVIGRRIQPQGGDIAASSAQFLLAFVFWWWSLHGLLSGQIPWRRLFPAGLATAVCCTGLEAYITFVMSSSITANEATYGLIGAVITLLTAEIGLAVALQLGAAIGAAIGHRKDGHRPGRSRTPADQGETSALTKGVTGMLTGMLKSTCRKCGKSIIKPAQSRGPGTSPGRSSWITNDSDGDDICHARPAGVPHEPQSEIELADED